MNVVFSQHVSIVVLLKRSISIENISVPWNFCHGDTLNVSKWKVWLLEDQ